METELSYTPRRSRMRRKPLGRALQITDGDIEIFKLLNRYRYLRSTFIYALLGTKRNRYNNERLGDLYHEGGYLNRPSRQWQFYNARYMPAIYENTDKAEAVLRERGLLGDQATWLLKRGPHREFAHALMICDILASIELGIRERPDLRFIGWQEVLSRAPDAARKSQNPFALPVDISFTFERSRKTHSARTHIVPDAIFGIEYRERGGKSYRFFAVEADRRSMPVYRSNLQQTSYLKKILSYRDITARKTYRTHLGLPNLMVLNVTTNERHMRGIMELVGQITQGSKMFCFKTLPSLGDMEKAPAPSPDMLTLPWSRVGHPDFNIDQA